MAAIEYRGLNAVTNFDLSRYINNDNNNNHNQNPSNNNQELDLNQELVDASDTSTTSSAVDLILNSSEFKEMLQNTTSSSSVEDSYTPSLVELNPPHRNFPEDIQTIFETQYSSICDENDDDLIFGDLRSIDAPIFYYELDA